MDLSQKMTTQTSQKISHILMDYMQTIQAENPLGPLKFLDLLESMNASTPISVILHIQILANHHQDIMTKHFTSSMKVIGTSRQVMARP